MKLIEIEAYEESREVTDDDANDEKSDEGFEDEAEDFDTLEEVNNASEENNEEDEEEEVEEDEQEEAQNLSDNELDVSIEGVRASDEIEEVSPELLSIPGHIDDNSAEPLEEVRKNDFVFSYFLIMYRR